MGLPVQQADLLPTLIEIAGGEPGPGIEGDSLVPLLHGGADGAPQVLADRLLLSTMDTFRRPAASLVRGRYKLIELRRPGHAPARQLFAWLHRVREAPAPRNGAGRAAPDADGAA